MGHKGKIFVTFATTIQKTIGPKKFCDNVPIISFITASRSADCIQQGNWLPRLSISHFVLLFIRFTDNRCFRIVKLSESSEKESWNFVQFQIRVQYLFFIRIKVFRVCGWGTEDIPCDPPNQATQRPLKIILVIIKQLLGIVYWFWSQKLKLLLLHLITGPV